jgi:hypothetical protein
MYIYEVRPRKDYRGVDLISIIAFGLLMICTQSVAQSEEEQKFYRLYPDLRAHKEVVQTAYEQLKQSGFQAKTVADANRAVAIRAYVLLNQSSGATMPYRQVLEECNWARSEYPALKDMSLPEFAGFMNEKTGSRAFDEGLNDSWLRRVGASIHTSFVNSWGFVVLVAALGLIFLWIVFRVTARTPTTGQEDHRQSAPPPPPPPPRASSTYISEEELAHARVLGLRGRITFDDVKRCYRERMQEYHPDKVNSLGQKLRDVAETETRKINAAYEFLSRKYGPNA